MLRQHSSTVHSDAALSCTVCGRRCSTRGSLRRHMTGHNASPRPRVSCDKCDKSFTSSSTLYHHKRAIHGSVKPYRCNKCGEQFNFNHSLKLHVLKHDGRRPYQCSVCGKSYLTASHLKYHTEAIHAVTKKFVCSVCGKSFPYETSFKLHKMLHAGDRPFTCSTCGKSFITRGALREHEDAHISNDSEQRQYRCEVCSRSYRTAALLRAHSRRHTADAARHVCEVCGRTFMYRSNLEAHVAVHTGERAYPCSICGKMFKTPATLYTHRIIHRTDTLASHVCTTCGKPFKTKERLKAHESRHSGIKPFKCRICGGAFPDRGGLAKHLKTVHAAKPRFACPECGKTANRLDNLRVHMRTHNNTSLLTLTAADLTSDLSAGGSQDLSATTVGADCGASKLQNDADIISSSVATLPKALNESVRMTPLINMIERSVSVVHTEKVHSEEVAGLQRFHAANMEMCADTTYVRHYMQLMANDQSFVQVDSSSQQSSDQLPTVMHMSFMP
jgi:KRAB domain-containing zinc finger protein